MGAVAVTGSVAYDHIMVFPGRFSEHILPEKTHVLNVSFLVDRLDRRRGGTAANITYTMALLGERPLLCATVGPDFAEYGEVLRRSGVDTTATLECDIPTATCFITTDMDDNQITAFYAGAMARAADVDLTTLRDVEHVVITPDAPDGMAVHIEQAATIGAKLVFAPAQQIPSLSDASLRLGLEKAWLIVGNDYEFEMIRNRTGLDVEALRTADTERVVVVTKGAHGSIVYTAREQWEIPAVAAAELVDPTGAGDAYIGGLLAGIRSGRSLPEAGRMAALAATYVVEVNGTQQHDYSLFDFARRYAAEFNSELSALPA